MIRSEIDDDVVVLTEPGIKSVTFANLHIDGDLENAATQNAFKLNQYTPYAAFENVSCQDCSGHAVAGDTIHNFRLKHLSARNIGGYLLRTERSGRVSSSWGTMVNCRLTGVDEESSVGVIDADALHQSTIINCVADSVVDSGFRIRDGFNNVIIGSGIERAHHYALELGDHEEGGIYEGGVITACWFRGSTEATNGFYFSYVSNFTIDGNTLEDFPGDDIHIENGYGLNWG